jgi:hypothetical protein
MCEGSNARLAAGSASNNEGGNIRKLGMILWLGGAALAAYAMLVFDTSVSAGYYGSRVVNLDLQQRQLMMLVVGCALFIVGAIMHIMGAKAPAGPSVSAWQAYKDEVKRRGDAFRAEGETRADRDARWKGGIR